MTISTEIRAKASQAVSPALVGRAASLSDRLGPTWQPEPGEAVRSAELVTRWCQVVSEGDEREFFSHLARLGAVFGETHPSSELADGVAARLGPGSYRGEQPVWVELAQSVVDHAHDLAEALGHEDEALPHLPGAQSIPFAHLYLPFLEAARDRLRLRASTELLSVAAVADLERWLVERLAGVCGATFEQEFAADRHRRGWGFLVGAPVPTGSYRRFVRRLLEQGLMPVFEEYPVLLRLAATATVQWVDATAELLVRVDADEELLTTEFGAGRDLGLVDAVTAGTSDAHHGGRSVHILTFAGGHRVVYKPRDLRAEAATHTLLGWLAGRHPAYDLTPLHVVVRDGYGWEEFAQSRPCTDFEGPARFFRRAGALLAVLHALGATDVHRENLVAVGDRPMLVDAETVLHPRLLGTGAGGSPDGAAAAAAERLHASVLTTQLLPGWQLAATGHAFDTAGLSGLDGRDASYPMASWRAINTDSMSREIVPTTLPPGDNAVRLPSGPVAPGAHRDDLLAGFRAAYRQLLLDRPALLAPDGPLAAFTGCRVRVLLRPTASYGLIAVSGQRGDARRDGATRGVALDRISRFFRGLDVPPSLWDLYFAEIEAMEQLDIPHFTVAADARRVDLPGGGLSRVCLRESPLEVLHSRLGALGEDDLRRQEHLVLGAFAARYGGADDARLPPVTSAAAPLTRALRPSRSSPGPLREADAVNRAIMLARRLRDDAVRGADGSLVWIGSSVVSESGATQIEVTGPDLYGGTTGIALFFASLSRVTGDATWAGVARSALSDLRWSLRQDPRRFVVELGLGGGTGAGSVIYGLTALARLLDDRDLLGDARVVAGAVDEEMIVGDTALDAVAGVAGLTLGMLTLYACTGDPAVLTAARRCGDRLLAAAVEPGTGELAWPGLSDPPLTGLSHGTSGAALALGRLFRVTGDSRYRDGSAAACRYEDRLFSAEHGTWPDLRPHIGRPYGGSAWCHGAAGIGFARLGLQRVLDPDRLRRDLERAVAASSDPEPGPRDSLCCGALGRALLLSEAGIRLGRPALTDTGAQLVGAVVTRADQAGGFRLDDGATAGVDSPGLFRGASGVGYALLQLHHGQKLPLPLTWE